MAVTSRFGNLPLLTSQVGVSPCDVCWIDELASAPVHRVGRWTDPSRTRLGGHAHLVMSKETDFRKWLVTANHHLVEWSPAGRGGGGLSPGRGDEVQSVHQASIVTKMQRLASSQQGVLELETFQRGAAGPGSPLFHSWPTPLFGGFTSREGRGALYGLQTGRFVEGGGTLQRGQTNG